MTTFIATAAVTASLMLVVWLVSLAKRDASIVDIFWGLGFVAIVWVAASVGKARLRRGFAAFRTVPARP